MPDVVCVLTPRAGQGSTTFATALAWEAAESLRVVLIDADPQGGLICDYLVLKPEGQIGITQLSGPRHISADSIMENSIRVEKRPNLRVVPGIGHGYCGSGVAVFLKKFDENQADNFYVETQRRRPSISMNRLDADLVIVDLGAPLAHPDLQNPQKVAEVITSVFHRVIVVMRDTPGMLVHNLRVLQASNLAKGDVVLVHEKGGDKEMRKAVQDALRHNVPNLSLSVEWAWKPDSALKAMHEGRGMPASGLAKSLDFTRML
jgi:MinD-like ATPase involved in chromosome partitioning or flagellar assembly